MRKLKILLKMPGILEQPMRRCCPDSAAVARARPSADAVPWQMGSYHTPVGPVPLARTQLNWRDRWSGCLARWGIRRRHYTVPPGLYAVGRPDANAKVFVSANYKLSFDILRNALNGINGWILALDTKGINVWCAAGKGTFGTAELVRRVAETRLAEVVSQRALIVPQLGATGVAAHAVCRQSGFQVVYGPVRAADLPAFLAAGLRATPAMRRVQFTLWDRLVVVPVEMAQRCIPALLIMLLLFLGAGLGPHGYRMTPDQWPAIAAAVWVNFLSGIVLTPVFLPWLPGRSLALKGAETGLATGAALWWFGRCGFGAGLAVGLLSVAACSVLGLIFTGSTPYTSPSGVRREMKWALPFQIAGLTAGGLLWLGARFL